MEQYGLLKGLVIAVVFVASCAIAEGQAAGEQAAEQERPDAVVVSLSAPWRPCTWAGPWDTEAAWTEQGEGCRLFHVMAADKRKVWTLYPAYPIEWARYPFVVMRYRAIGLQFDAAYGLWLDDTTGPNRDHVTPISQPDWIGDGEYHEFRFDLRLHNPPLQGPVIGMAFGLHADRGGEALFELQDLRFEAPPEAEPAPEPERDAAIAFRVVDSDAKPVAGAVVRLDPEYDRFRVEGKTGADGVAELTPWLFEEPGKHVLWVEAEGMVPVSCRNIRDLGDPPFEVKLSHAQTLSGRVVDEEGEPVEGAVVSFRVTDAENSSGRRYLWPWPASNPLTDANGHWRTDLISADATRVQLQVVHPEFLSDLWPGQYTKEPTLENLRAGTAVTVLKRGVRVEGKVFAVANGEPVANARVTQGGDYSPRNRPPATNTAHDGSFVFPITPPGRLVMVITAEGYHPALVETVAEHGMNLIVVSLGEPATARFRFVDKNGEPVHNFELSAYSWRGYNVLKWSGRSDGNGRVVWSNAPRDAVSYLAKKTGWLSTQDLTFTAGEEEHVIEVCEQLTVIGRVVHAETKEPVTSFTYLPGQVYGDRPPYWQSASKSSDGAFEKSFTEQGRKYVLRVEAAGFAPAVSRELNTDEGRVELLFELTPAEDIVGKVVDADGNPCPGVGIVTVKAGQTLSFVNGKSYTSSFVTTETDADGGFRLPPMLDESLKVVFFGDSGYAEVDSAEAEALSAIKLEPWATVKGVLRIGAEVGARETIEGTTSRLSHSVPQAVHRTQVQTDGEGKFSFERVPAGEFILRRPVRIGRGIASAQQSAWLDVKAGETVNIQLGGTGRPVVGRFLRPAEHDGDWDWAGSSSVQPVIEMPDEREFRPESYAAMKRDEREEWRKQWEKTDEYREFEARRRKLEFMRFSVYFSIEDDGSFRIDDLPAGLYRLSAKIREPAGSGAYNYSEPLATLNQQFEIPEMPGGRSDEPLDLGELTMQFNRLLRVGRTAPDFQTETLDGQPFSLAAQRGKFVLLDVWSTLMRPERNHLPKLKTLFERFGGRDDFVMVGLSTDRDINTLKGYIEEHKIGWTQCFRGSEKAKEVMEAFVLRSGSGTLLIGPDGKVVARDLRDDTIISAVEQALPPPGLRP